MNNIAERLEHNKLKLRQAFDKLEEAIEERLTLNENQSTLEIKLELAKDENQKLHAQLNTLQKKCDSIKNGNLGILEEVKESIKQIETLLDKK